MLANLATSLFEHGRITTTETKAKRLRPLAERLITFAKRGDLHARRQVLTVIRDKDVVHTLFAEIAPQFADPPGWLHPDHQDRPAQGRQRPDGGHRAGRGPARRPSRPSVKPSEPAARRSRPISHASKRTAEMTEEQRTSRRPPAAVAARPRPPRRLPRQPRMRIWSRATVRWRPIPLSGEGSRISGDRGAQSAAPDVEPDAADSSRAVGQRRGCRCRGGRRPRHIGVRMMKRDRDAGPKGCRSSECPLT